MKTAEEILNTKKGLKQEGIKTHIEYHEAIDAMKEYASQKSIPESQAQGMPTDTETFRKISSILVRYEGDKSYKTPKAVNDIIDLFKSPTQGMPTDELFKKLKELIECYRTISKFSDASRYHEGIITKVKIQQLESEIASLESAQEQGMPTDEKFWSDLSDRFYESKIAHDYKDGKIDYRKIREWFLSQSHLAPQEKKEESGMGCDCDRPEIDDNGLCLRCGGYDRNNN